MEFNSKKIEMSLSILYIYIEYENLGFYWSLNYKKE